MGSNRATQRGDQVHDRQTIIENAAGRIDVDVDVLLGIFGFEKQQLRDDDIGDSVIDRRANKNNPVF